MSSTASTITTSADGTGAPGNAPVGVDDTAAIVQLHETVARQRAAFAADRYPALEVRKDRLRALIAGLLGARTQIREAIDTDFRVHAHHFTDMAEVLAPVGRALYVLDKLDEWAADSPRFLDPAFFGTAHASMRYQPKGVIGNMVPWNLPFEIGLGPVTEMLAAGNRVVIKPSELTPTCAEVLRTIVAASFDPDLVSVAVGGRDLSIAFAKVPWDHLLFTGGTEAGRAVAVSAAANLTPVTLELGGKSPALVAPGEVTAETIRVVVGAKLMNGGQVCVSPDHVMVHRDDIEDFVAAAGNWVRHNVPDYTDGASGTGMISDSHLERLTGMVEQAQSEGARVIELGGSGVRTETRQLPLQVVVDPSPTTAMMTQEIFGPVLPVVPYDTIDGAVEAINAGERPLGLYVFTADAELAEDVLTRTTSGGACVNACAMQAQNDVGFGGSGASGYGRHHGPEGFREFSNQRGVFVRGSGDISDAFLPPYTDGVAAFVQASYAALEALDPST